MNLHSANESILRRKLQWVLQITTAFCFIGHGAWGVITKAGWLPFFAVVGIQEPTAWQLMPVIGIVDIATGLLILYKPYRPILIWMVLWALWTALLRPLSGTPGFWEVLERSGNFIPPLLLLLMQKNVSIERLKQIIVVGIALLLIGHGGFGAFVKMPILIDHWNSIGIPIGVREVVTIGYFEILLGLAILKPKIPLIWFILFWKICTEFLYITNGGLINIFEFIERAGDYGLPIALLLILHFVKRKKLNK